MTHLTLRLCGACLLLVAGAAHAIAQSQYNNATATPSSVVNPSGVHAPGTQGAQQSRAVPLHSSARDQRAVIDAYRRDTLNQRRPAPLPEQRSVGGTSSPEAYTGPR